jgi:transcriptional regulator with XRE-family HTH domain
MSPSATPLRTRLGKRIRNFRLAKGWSQEALGAEAGLSYKFIGEVERGVANPSLSTLEALGEALHIDITELFGPPRPLTGATEYVPTRRESQAARDALASLEGFVRQFSPASPEGPDVSYKKPRRSRTR